MVANRWILLVFVVFILPFGSVLAAPISPATHMPAQEEDFTFGIILVGPQNDKGWSQAHYEAGLYVQENIPNSRLLVAENINAGNPDRPFADVVAEMVGEGAQLIIANSDDYKDDVHRIAREYPDVIFLHVSGDGRLTGVAPENVTNFMGAMEYGKMIAGCAAALTTQTGKIGYLGALINNETRRLAYSAYLGARYCYETYRGMNADDLSFEVIWIGFWFEIPDFTLNPTEVTHSFYDGGADVVISGIDTPNALVVAGERRAAGEPVWAIPYDYILACDLAPDACLGVPYFNWSPAYLNVVQTILDGTFFPSWDWLPVDWRDINNRETTAVGYIFGPALPESVRP